MATKPDLGAADRRGSQFLTDSFQRGLAHWNRERLAPQMPAPGWPQALARALRMLRLEQVPVDPPPPPQMAFTF